MTKRATGFVVKWERGYGNDRSIYTNVTIRLDGVVDFEPWTRTVVVEQVGGKKDDDTIVALLAVEWEGRAGPAGDVRGECAACEWSRTEGHQAGCLVDVALTKAGLSTQAERDAARESLGLR